MARTREISLNQNTSGWTETDASSPVMTTIAEYTVPAGAALIFKPQHTISLYLEDNEATAAELNGSCPIEVIIERPFGIGTDLLASAEYTEFKEFQDVTKKRANRVMMAARANSVIKIRVNPNFSTIGSIDASDCRYALQATLMLD